MSDCNLRVNSKDMHLFKEGTWTNSYDKFGAHPETKDGIKGYRFTVWAPGAMSVHLVGEFNNWDVKKHNMKPNNTKEIWTIFIPGIKEGQTYKYLIETKFSEKLYKADPYAYYAELRPETASKIMNIDKYSWGDKNWIKARQKNGFFNRPFNIYEVSLSSWRRKENGDYYSYRELADELVEYVVSMGYTHIEIMPVMEHPFDGSWGYQITGYYAPTSRYGEPKDFMYLIDKAHKAGIGVIIDWVPGHFCRDAHGLGNFTGMKVYEAKEHLQWGTYTFDFSKGEVRSFLISNILFWIEKYHVDGIRVDGVSSILYMNFGIDNPAEKKYNPDGTEGDLDAIAFLQKMNTIVGTLHPDVMIIAEESTAWPLVTRPPESGGLGFHYKWDMGWMNDTLNYIKTDFPYKPYNHNQVTFSMMYAYNENFILPLSHDEVVHGKCSIIGRMPGDTWRKFAGVRALLLYQMCHPGAKLNFMGNEFAQFIEWRYYEQLEWFLMKDYEAHKKINDFVKTLNHLYKEYNALWIKDLSWEGFEWIDADNNEQCIISFVRHGKKPIDDLVVVINFSCEAYNDYRIGVPMKGYYKEIFNSDDKAFGGAGVCNDEIVKSEKKAMHGMDNSISIRLGAIGGIILKRVGKPKK